MISGDDDAAKRRREGRKEGTRRKDAVHDVLEALNQTLIRDGRRVFASHCSEAGWVNADIVHENITIPEHINPTFLGCVPGPFIISGLVHEVRWVKSSRPTAHGRKIPVYEPTSDEARVALRQWLVDNPAPADVVTTDAADLSTKPIVDHAACPPLEPCCVIAPVIPATIQPTEQKPTVQKHLFDDAGGNTDAQC